MRTPTRTYRPATRRPRYDCARFGGHRLRAPTARSSTCPSRSPPARRCGWRRSGPTRTPRRLGPPALGRRAGDRPRLAAPAPARRRRRPRVRRRHRQHGPVRWYGIMDTYEVDRWATIQGPYPHPDRRVTTRRRAPRPRTLRRTRSNRTAGAVRRPVPATPSTPTSTPVRRTTPPPSRRSSSTEVGSSPI